MLERWFEKRRKSKALEIASRQMTLALDTVNDLERSIILANNGDLNATKTTIERLFKVEEEIDDMRREVFEELTKGSLPSKEREDIMRLVTNLDVMADYVKDSARDVLILVEEDLPKELWKAVLAISSALVSTAAMLKECLMFLSEDPSKARVLSEKVEDEESKVDQKQLEAKSLLIKLGDKVSAPILLILKDLIDSMEEAADSCADTGDYIRLLTVSFKES
jgi:predicted phosphate transport protein (TIGR00153 family)